MRTPILFAVALGALALGGCQASTGSSTYAGGIDSDRQTRVAPSPYVRKKVGKERRVARDGSVYYVNKYVRVKKGASAKRGSGATSAYAPRKRKPAAVRAVAKAIKAAPKRIGRAAAKITPASKKRPAKGGPKNIDRLIAKHARANGVPVKLARAVVKIESAYRPNARGAAGEIGLMQLRPQTARGMGYKGKMKQLYNPDTNLAYGMKYLGEAYRRGGKTPCGAVLKYNAGHYAKRWNPISRKYCKRVKAIMKKG